MVDKYCLIQLRWLENVGIIGKQTPTRGDLNWSVMRDTCAVDGFVKGLFNQARNRCAAKTIASILSAMKSWPIDAERVNEYT